MDFKTLELSGASIAEFIDDMAQLRMAVFREWPYIYDGSLSYEKKYLLRYSQAKNAYVQLIFDKEQLIGLCSALDLQEEDQEFQEAYAVAGYSPNKVVYFGESIILPHYRGHKLGHQFMEGRLNFARNLDNREFVSFCTVIRPDTHPLKPKDYRRPDKFWERQGFSQVEGLQVQIPWRDIGEDNETLKDLQVWIKKL